MLDTNNWNLYIEIKSSISAADTKLGIRITTLGIEITIITMILIHFNANWLVYLFILGFLVLEMGIASLGLLPILGNKKIKHNKNENFKNKYYFGYIASFSNLDEYIKYLNKNENEINNKDIIEQIYVNSKILNRKYQYYNRSRIFWFAINQIYTKLKNLKNRN